MSNLFFLYEGQHIFITLAISLFLFWRYRNWRLIPICFLFGFFIDADHLVDYFSYSGLNFNLQNFFNTKSYMIPSGKIYVPLHGWEFAIVFWLISRWIGKKKKINGPEWAISLPFLAHLLIDNFTFVHHPLAYSLLFRLLNGFDIVAFHSRWH